MSVAPHRHECVLDGGVDDVGVGAPTRQPGAQPWGMPPMQELQGIHLRTRHRAQQLDIAAELRGAPAPVFTHSLHTRAIAVVAAFGSPTVDAVRPENGPYDDTGRTAPVAANATMDVAAARNALWRAAEVTGADR
ncbi:hypothetical protein, partial [Micromonospora sp. NPDC005313]|uniref:hypothetical protein n=1 Tax=Micromonospora sp. NPDC005313 TaxID=3154296 RepID=UPI0033B4E086